MSSFTRSSIQDYVTLSCVQTSALTALLLKIIIPLYTNDLTCMHLENCLIIAATLAVAYDGLSVRLVTCG